MENEVQEIVRQATSWTPELIVSLIKEVVWPITILVLGWRFRGSVTSALSNLFSKSKISELSAGATGVTAKFIAAQQSAESKEESDVKTAVLPEGADYESLKSRHKEQNTEFSLDLFENIKRHIDALGVSDPEKIELLSKELSLLQAALRYLDINKVLFRSQFDLFNIMPEDGSTVPEIDLRHYFKNVADNNPEGLGSWDFVKYLAYPTIAGIIEYQDGGYKLTKLGHSYVKFMRKNLSLIDDLGKL